MVAAVRAFTFDLEGTIVDLELAHHMGHLAAAKELGLKLTLDEAREMIPSFVGGPDTAVAAELRTLSGRDVSVEYVLALSRYHYLKARENTPAHVRPGVIRFLEEARARGYEIALGSVTTQEDGRTILENARLADFFPPHVRVFLEDVRAPKPAPDVYLETASKCGIEPIEQLVFEDSPVGALSARAAGSPVVGIPVLSGESVRRRLHDAGVIAIFDDWTAVTVDCILGLANA
jgi:HAD superfamily hydrolase (TIGR01509 family)